jgi:hypothetical protein
MQFKTLALASALALSSSMAFAQAGGNDAGATVPETSGTAVDSHGAAVGTVDRGRMMNRTPGTTTGMSQPANIPHSGPNNTPGGIDHSKVGGESTARNPE